MKRHYFWVLASLLAFSARAQQKLNYQNPPQEIMELVDVSLAPSVAIDSKGEQLVLMYRDPYKSIAELSEEEMRLAGLRINPKTNIGSRVTYYNDLKLKEALKQDVKVVKGLPSNPRLSNFSWSPNEKLMAFTHTTEEGVELWLLDIARAEVRRLMPAVLNANLGQPMLWLADSESLLVRRLPADRQPLVNTDQMVPVGPVVSVSTGEKAQNRTYQDLLKNPQDEANFEQLARAEIKKVNLKGEQSDFLPAAMYRGMDLSPNGEYLLLSEMKKPFSYLVPYSRFPFEEAIYNLQGQKVTTLAQVPLTEVLPKGFMAERKGRRDFAWRNDKPATITWAEALDGGDPEQEVEYRDALYELPEPFTAQPVELMKTRNRLYGVMWGNDELAVAYDYWWNNRNTKTYLFNPGQPGEEAKLLFDRNYQDRYSDPGSFVQHKNKYQQRVLTVEDGRLFLMGAGFSEKGQFPFVDAMEIASGKTERLYQSPYTDRLEDLRSAVDMKEGLILVRIESPSEYPNYYLRNIYKENSLQEVTSFENPFKSLQEVHKEVISYQREDGLKLDATLYLPLDYDREKKEKMPMVMWAYPREFKDKASASQNTSNPNEFVYPYYGSPIYWVTRGYVVLDDAAFPIVGEGEEEPNDSFRKQLVANAKAAIDAVDAMGYIDRDRVAVGGHSYGAFMVANLLSHSDLFAAGIARSGAYNRTLTPFGFQSEERSYWESPETYYDMSPFMHADKMKTPLLIVHGEADNNSGTYPLQSERYFNALKGLGGPARLVMLPRESHGYRARESILHLLWEQDRWLETYVKNRSDQKEETSSN